MRKLLLLLFLVHCGMMAYSVPLAIGCTHGKHISFVFKQHSAHYQSIVIENDIDDELEDDGVELKSTPLFQLAHANIYNYVVPARAPGFEFVNHKGFALAVPPYLLFQQFRI